SGAPFWPTMARATTDPGCSSRIGTKRTIFTLFGHGTCRFLLFSQPPHGGERAAMQRTGPVRGQRRRVLAGAVAFVPGETVGRIYRVPCGHDAVAHHFGHDARGGDDG